MQNKLSEYNWHIYIYTLIKQLSIWYWDSVFIVLKGIVS